jgi:hypothetical protein
MKSYLHIRFEVLLLKIAKWILMGRNVGRSQHVSRRDNNDMWYMAESIGSIEVRMLNKYNDIKT